MCIALSNMTSVSMSRLSLFENRFYLHIFAFSITSVCSRESGEMRPFIMGYYVNNFCYRPHERWAYKKLKRFPCAHCTLSARASISLFFVLVYFPFRKCALSLLSPFLFYPPFEWCAYVAHRIFMFTEHSCQYKKYEIFR